MIKVTFQLPLSFSYKLRRLNLTGLGKMKPLIKSFSSDLFYGMNNEERHLASNHCLLFLVVDLIIKFKSALTKNKTSH